jgi:cytochrome c
MRLLALSLAFAAELASQTAWATTAKDIADGQDLFDHGCTACHDDTGYMVTGDGPALFGIVGRPVGSVPGFTYSPALQAARRNGDVWTDERLQTFLIDPARMYPGTTMPWSFSEAKDRKAMTAYLKSLTLPKPTR